VINSNSIAWFFDGVILSNGWWSVDIVRGIDNVREMLFFVEFLR
jgi:hypothetical protein